MTRHEILSVKLRTALIWMACIVIICILLSACRSTRTVTKSEAVTETAAETITESKAVQKDSSSAVTTGSSTVTEIEWEPLYLPDSITVDYGTGKKIATPKNIKSIRTTISNGSTATVNNTVSVNEINEKTTEKAVTKTKGQTTQKKISPRRKAWLWILILSFSLWVIYKNFIRR